ncbi:MAG: hypothetical protein GY928_02110 [Colwellia sp.]|nr:hypothetical protein [Colwellia sp.]
MEDWKKGLSEKEIITFKYHKHIEGDEKEGMTYFTLEDVHKCMEEYAITCIKTKYKVHNHTRNSYIRDIDDNSLVFSGTLSDCYAWLKLKEGGYFN